MVTEQDLTALKLIQGLLEEAIGLADVHGETLVAVHVEQALYVLDGRMARLRSARG